MARSLGRASAYKGQFAGSWTVMTRSYRNEGVGEIAPARHFGPDWLGTGMERKFEVAVVGGGPTGVTAAIALAAAGVETALIAKARPADNRTTALLSGSVAALDALGVWPLCRADAASLTAIR